MGRRSKSEAAGTLTDTHVVSALKAKRIELASQIEDYRDKMRLSVIAPDHAEASLKLCKQMLASALREV